MALRNQDLKRATRGEANAVLAKAQARNTHLDFKEDVNKLFTRESIHVAYDDSITSISRSESYHKWSFGSWKTKPTTEELRRLLVFLLAEANASWGQKRMFSFVNDKCPFAHEFQSTGRLAQELVNAVNLVTPGGALLLRAPTSMTLPVKNSDGKFEGTTTLEVVYAHTLPFEFIDSP